MTAERGNTLFLAGAIAVVVLAIGAGFYVLGGPATVRAKRLDAERLDDLRSIAGTLRHHWTEHGRLPTSLQDTNRMDEWGRLDLEDPQTRQPYEYRVVRDSAYVLCASFDRASGPGVDTQWQHAAGRACFTIDAR